MNKELWATKPKSNLFAEQNMSKANLFKTLGITLCEIARLARSTKSSATAK